MTSRGLEMVALALMCVCGCCLQIRHTTSALAVHVCVEQQSTNIPTYEFQAATTPPTATGNLDDRTNTACVSAAT